MAPGSSQKSKKSAASHANSNSNSNAKSKSGIRASSPATPKILSLCANDEAISRVALRKASMAYPCFISEQSFFGHVVHLSMESKDFSAIVWMSDSAMLSHSISPGTAVSVALAADIASPDAFPLEPLTHTIIDRLADEDASSTDLDKAGAYFAVAMVWPSRKLQKNEVRVSRQLSYTMGCPRFGGTIYITALHFSMTSDLALKTIRPAATALGSLSKCTISLSERATLKLRLIGQIKDNGSDDGFVTKVFSSESETENSRFSSPKTPVEQKFKNNHSKRLASAEKVTNNDVQEKQLSEVSKDTEVKSRSDCVMQDTIIKILQEESMKDVISSYSVRLLGGRILLAGNIVSIPICGQMSTFCVESVGISSNELEALESVHGANQDKATVLKNEVGEVHPGGSHAVVYSCIVGHETNINLVTDKKFQSDTKANVNLASLNPNGNNENKIDERYLDFKGHGISALGGLSEEIAALKEIIYFSLKEPHKLTRLGLQPTRGVLLYGPPGTGKTSLASFCAHEAGVNMHVINGPEIINEYYGESEQALHAVFRSAEKFAPSMVFIDELDAIAPARKEGSEGLSQRMVAALLSLIDGANRNDRILVIAATNRPEFIDPALRRPGRLDREFEIGVPSVNQRLEILEAILKRMKHSITVEDIRTLASETHGFVGADVSALCNEAALAALRRYIREHSSPGAGKITHNDLSSFDIVSGLSNLSILSGSNKKEPKAGNEAVQDANVPEIFSDLQINVEDFQVAKLKVRPSAMREVMLEIPKVRWEDIGGQAEVKQQLKEAVEWPQKHQDAFLRIGAQPPRGVLMFGPPGCSKTLTARAVASEAGINFMAVKGPELFSKWVGESEKAIQSLFAKARAAAPSIIFFDEIDGLAQTREHGNTKLSVGERVMSQLLVEMDGLNSRAGVTVIAATNRPDKIDSALLRPGRFDRLVYVGPPNQTDRKEIFDVHTRQIPCASDVSKKYLAELTHGYTGADIAAVCREAALVALEENIDIMEISMSHFEAALKRIQPSDLSDYENLSSNFQRLTASKFPGTWV